MSTLAEHAQNYLTIRRALGFKLVGEGVLLAEFVAFAEKAGQHTITTQFALEWARRPRGGSRNYLSRRLRAVRAFARYLHVLDPACEIPPLELLPASKYRPAPYLYGDEEIIALMTAAGGLRPPLRAATFRTLIGLLACTGTADRRSDPAGPRRLRLDPPAVDGPRFEVREITRGAAARQHRAARWTSYGEIRDRLCPHPEGRAASSSPPAGPGPCHPTIHQPFRSAA